MNILFICSRNQWRSPTAETIFRSYPGIHIKSAGTANNARIKVTAKMLQWADLVLVMEKKHHQRLRQKFEPDFPAEKVKVLYIPDQYPYMDPELIECLRITVKPYLPVAAVSSKYKAVSTRSQDAEERYND